MAQYHPQPGVSIGPNFTAGGQFEGFPYTSNVSGPILVGSHLYLPAVFIDYNSGDFFITVSLSSDYGKTWSILDVAHQPVHGAGISCVLSSDGHNIIICYANDPGDALRFRNFDTATGLWGVDYGAVGGGPIEPVTGGTTTVVQKSDGTLSVIFSNGASLLSIQTFDPVGLSWTAAANVCANMILLPDWDAAQSSVNNNWTTLFLNDEIYIFFHIDSGLANWEFRAFFQLIRFDNSTPGANFFDFPNNEVNPPDLQIANVKLGIPCLLRGSIVLPISRTDLTNFPGGNVRRASLYWGQVVPGISQTWTELMGNVDPGYGPAPDYSVSFDWLNLSNSMGQAVYDGSQLYIVYTGTASLNGSVFGNDEIRLCVTNPFSDDPNDWIWSGSTAQSVTTPPFDLIPNAFFLFVTILVVGNYVILQTTLFSGGNVFSFWLGNFGPVPTYYFDPPPSYGLPFECCMDFHLGCILKV